MTLWVMVSVIMKRNTGTNTDCDSLGHVQMSLSHTSRLTSAPRINGHRTTQNRRETIQPIMHVPLCGGSSDYVSMSSNSRNAFECYDGMRFHWISGLKFRITWVTFISLLLLLILQINALCFTPYRPIPPYEHLQRNLEYIDLWHGNWPSSSLVPCYCATICTQVNYPTL